MITQEAAAPGGARVDRAAATFRLLSDPTRLRILAALVRGERSVSELADDVGANPPAVSQHLAKLRAARVVDSRRQGNRILYAAPDGRVADLLAEALAVLEPARG